MTLESGAIWAFLLVFVRCSALLLASPVFGAQSTPVAVRVFTTMAIAGALSVVVRPGVGPPPPDLYTLIVAIANEAFYGLVIGLFVTLALSAFQVAGAFMDFQIGLGSSQIVNPVSGFSSTLLSNFKHLLALVILFALGGHHVLFRALVESYSGSPMFGAESLPALKAGVMELVKSSALLGLQIATPIVAVSVVVDAALGLVNRAVPQMPVLLVGMPAKVAMGILALSLGLPALVSAVETSVGMATGALHDLILSGR